MPEALLIAFPFLVSCLMSCKSSRSLKRCTFAPLSKIGKITILDINEEDTSLDEYEKDYTPDEEITDADDKTNAKDERAMKKFESIAEHETDDVFEEQSDYFPQASTRRTRSSRNVPRLLGSRYRLVFCGMHRLVKLRWY